MKHPDPEKNQYQAEFLAECQPESRRFYELMFMVGNATYTYHLAAREYEVTESLWNEWLEGLSEPVKSGMAKMGFEKGRLALPFTRYVNEKNDLGLDKYLEQMLGAEILKEYNSLIDKA